MSHPTAEALMRAALEISEAAAAIPMRYFRSDVNVEDKPDDTPVTRADREAEALIRQAIAARYPDHGIFGEEFGVSASDAAITWIIDPIDGTRPFICGVPLFGMLLGVLEGETPVAGVIRMPALGECFAGCRGGEASKDGAPINCSDVTELAKARIFLNEADLMAAKEPERLKRLMTLGHIRRFFNDCYAYALLAMGQIDVVVDFDLMPYDILPAVPLVEAAGGIITDWEGAPLDLNSDGTVIAAATPELHRAIQERLR